MVRKTIVLSREQVAKEIDLKEIIISIEKCLAEFENLTIL